MTRFQQGGNEQHIPNTMYRKLQKAVTEFQQCGNKQDILNVMCNKL